MTALNYVGAGDATDLEHAREEARNPDGTFGKHPPRPETSSAEPKEADQVEGSWYFPPIFKTAEDFCTFWEEAPVPEEALARFRSSYDRMFDKLTPQEQARSPEFISIMEARPVARAAMMMVYSRALPDDDQLKVLDHKIDFGHGQYTVSQVTERFRTDDIGHALFYDDPAQAEAQRRAEEAKRREEEAAERARDRALRERELVLQERELALQEQLLAEQRRANELNEEIRRGTAQISNMTRREMTGNRDFITGDRIDRVPRAAN